MSTSLAVVPYEQMERMATAVVKSGLFGMKTAEQALTLMALAQAEGIHPMTAVRDYHIIQGRPSIKAETMLSRFLAAGGRVEWHEYSDAKSDATFTHPAGGSVRVSWDMERAAKAGLTGKDVWKAYGRAMLRSRAISEGIRTVCPGVVQGVYSPEEIESMSPEATAGSAEQAVQSFAQPIMPSDVVADYLRSIKECKDQDSLKRAFAMAHKAAVDAKDGARIGAFTIAYNDRKEELATVSQEPSI